MLAQEARLAGLDVDFRFQDRHSGCSASLTGWPVLSGSLEDEQLLQGFLQGLTHATYESENTPVGAVETLQNAGVLVFPGPKSLVVCQDRLTEKTFLKDLGIATAPYASVLSPADLEKAVYRLGVPGILKSRQFGYDGKGQTPITDALDREHGWRLIAGVPAIYEGWVSFRRELSQISVRSQSGEIVHYPLTANEHRGGILRRSRAGEPVWDGYSPQRRLLLEMTARKMSEKILENLGHVGTLAVELFETEEGDLIVNELAPRVHNSGHWTIEGAVTSQFENHLRAGLGLDLGATDLHPDWYGAEMANYIGQMPSPEEQQDLQSQGWVIHDYRKRPAPGRKVGHGTRRLMAPKESGF
jgi:5-(carboxyamino)imidazole ribonucleotide synthase